MTPMFESRHVWSAVYMFCIGSMGAATFLSPTTVPILVCAMGFAIFAIAGIAYLES